MFTSISRGRTKFKQKYICTLCLAYISPRIHPPSACQVLGRPSFSTTSINRQSDQENASDDAGSDSTRFKRIRQRQRRRLGGSAKPVSRSRDALAALKDSLLAEEAAARTPKLKPNSTAKNLKSNPNTDAAEIVISARSGKSSSGTSRRTDKSSPGRGKVKVKDSSGTKERKGKSSSGIKKVDGEASPRTREKAVKASADTKEINAKEHIGVEEKAVRSKETSSNPKAKKSAETTKTPNSKTEIPATINDAAPLQNLAQDVAEEAIQTRGKNKARRLSDSQRQKAEAVLLDAKTKRAAELSKITIGQVHSIGKNETRDALVKIIESGKFSKSDDEKPIRITQRVGVEKNLVRKHFSRSSSSYKLTSLGRRTQSRRLKDRKASVVKSVAKARSGNIENPRNAGRLISKKGFEIKTIDATDLELTPIHKSQPPVPNLSYGLDRVLFNPGVYHLRDPRSRVYNFDPYLQTIMPVEEFDFTALKRYVTSSRDETLLATAREEKKKYTGSTSSMTAALAHFHFLLSQWRPINTGILSQSFPVEFDTFTNLQRGPSAIFLRWKDGVYAIDADKQFDTANILSILGKSMEKLLTLPTEDFEKYRKENSDQISLEEREAAEPFNYTTMGDFLMRSQLDAHDPRLPGTGMFDLKTRAVVSIRMDVTQYEQGRDYEIRKRYGEFESFEREYYDMIRAAFLKYSLQVRMGRMDGIFVAFHNTKRIFGFQYISQPEMDLALHGIEDSTIGDAEFKLSLELLNKVLDRATARYPEKSLRLHIETRNTVVPFMYIFAEPMEDEQITEIQESNKAIIEGFEKRVLGLEGEDAEKVSEESRRAAEWSSIRAQVEQTMKKDELDLAEARTLAESMIEESNIFGSEAISAEEKERLINELLESSAFNDVEDEDVMVSKEDGDTWEDGFERASADSEADDVDEGNEDDNMRDEEEIEENSEDRQEEECGQSEEPESLEQAKDQDHLAECPNDHCAGEVETAAIATLAGPSESVEPTKEVYGEVKTSSMEIPDITSAGPDIVENKDLAPDEEGLESDVSKDTNPDPEASRPTQRDAATSATKETSHPDQPELLAMTLTIRNKVNGNYVTRPEGLRPSDKWTIEYALEDIDPARTRSLYEACKARRARTLNNHKRDESNKWNDRFMENLWNLSKKGRRWRERQNRLDSKGPLRVLGEKITQPDQMAAGETCTEGADKSTENRE